MFYKIIISQCLLSTMHWSLKKEKNAPIHSLKWLNNL